MRGFRLGTVHMAAVAAMAAVLPFAWPWSKEAAKDGAAVSAPAEQEPVYPGQNGGPGGGKVVRRSLGRVEFERREQQSASLAAGSALAARIRNGSIHVTGREQDGCGLSATVAVSAGSEKRAVALAGQVRIQLVSEGSRLRIDVDEPRTSGNESIRVALEVQVPRRTSPDLSSSNGAIHLKDLDGHAVCQTSNGKIDLQSVAGKVDLKTSNGAIEAKDLAADAQADTSNGRIRLAFADGGPWNCTAETSNGQILCRNLSGDLQADTSNGSVDAEYAAGASGVRQIQIGTGNGSIRLVTPKDLSAQVQARTSMGRIRTTLPLTVKKQFMAGQAVGSLGSGQGHVQLHSTSGSIDLQ